MRPVSDPLVHLENALPLPLEGGEEGEGVAQESLITTGIAVWTMTWKEELGKERLPVQSEASLEAEEEEWASNGKLVRETGSIGTIVRQIEKKNLMAR